MINFDDYTNENKTEHNQSGHLFQIIRTEHLLQVNETKAFMEYSNEMQDVYKNIEDYNPDKKRKLLIVFDDMIADMVNVNNNNDKLDSIVMELFTRVRKLNISIVFITRAYFKLPKDVRLNSTHFFYENSK